jgi:tRNA(Ile)-lysidine synthase
MGTQKVARPREHSPSISGFRQEVRRSLLSDAAGVQAGDRLVVACSHGPDSLALADAVLALRRPLDLGEITLVYVDHGLRRESVGEGEAVLAFAAAHGARGVVEKVHVAPRGGGGPEERARRARHAALEAAADRAGATLVLLGHNAGDQSETVLMHLLRGSGVRGLAGIPERRGRFFRPMLRLPRAAVEAYNAARGLTPSFDASNASDDFLRNRLRLEVLPLLRRENPALDDSLGRAAAALRELDDAVEALADRVEAEAALDAPAGERALARAVLRTQPAVVGKRVVQRAATRLDVSLSASQIDAAWRMVTSPGSGRSLSAKRLAIRCERERIRFRVRASGR